MEYTTFALFTLYFFTIYYCFGPYKIIQVDPMTWWISLSATTALIFLYSVYGKIFQESKLRRYARIVCFCYMHRAIFMHCTVERDCFWDFPLCSPLWGRTVACTGELTFVYMASRQLIANTKISNLVVFLISIAQTISFIGVMKKHYYWFFIENSIWTICAFGMAIHMLMYNKKKKFNAVKYILLAFVIYNVTEDLPMYLKRDAEKTHLNNYNIGVIEGAIDAITCDVVSQSSKIWDPQMLWQTLNYTTVPMACISFMVVENIDVEDDSNNKKKDT